MKAKSFNELIQGETPVLVDFFATWCGPCKAQAPILDDLKSKMGSKAHIIKVDVDRNQAAAAKYQIRSVPTMMIFKNGKIVWRQSGVFQANELKRLLENA
jgi:thioredoxin 1